MKQNSLNNSYSQTSYESESCLAGFVLRWSLFGLGMWWLSGGIGYHALAWLFALAIGFMLIKRELWA